MEGEEGQCGGHKRMCGRKIKRKKQGEKRGQKENLKRIAQSDSGFILVKILSLVLAGSKMVAGREEHRER